MALKKFIHSTIILHFNITGILLKKFKLKFLNNKSNFHYIKVGYKENSEIHSSIHPVPGDFV